MTGNVSLTMPFLLLLLFWNSTVTPKNLAPKWINFFFHLIAYSNYCFISIYTFSTTTTTSTIATVPGLMCFGNQKRGNSHLGHLGVSFCYKYSPKTINQQEHPKKKNNHNKRPTTTSKQPQQPKRRPSTS